MSGDYKSKQYKGVVEYVDGISDLTMDRLRTFSVVLEYQKETFMSSKNPVYHAYFECDDKDIMKAIVSYHFKKIGVVRIGYGNHPKYGKIPVFKIMKIKKSVMKTRRK
jgi:hypothetical protein